MFKNILVPTDGSELAAKAVEQGVLFAKETGAKITAVTVTEPFPLGAVTESHLDAPLEYKKLEEAHADKVLEAVSAAARQAGVTCETLRMEHAQVYQAIIEVASARGCDLIVMASHGRRGVSAVVLGSETVKVLTHSKIPVLVYRWVPRKPAERAEPFLDTTSDFAEIVFAILGVAAKLEHRRIKERTARGRADAKAMGVKFGRKPKLTPHQQREAIRRRDVDGETLRS